MTRCDPPPFPQLISPSLFPSPVLPLSAPSSLQIKCPSGVGCVGSTSNFCDGLKDFSDGSDEDPTFCGTFNCSADGRVREGDRDGEREFVSLCMGVWVSGGVRI